MLRFRKEGLAMERLSLDTQRRREPRGPVFGILLMAGLVFIAVAVYYTFDFFHQTNLAVQEAKAATRGKMGDAIQKVDGDFAKLERIVHQSAEKFNQTRFSQAEIGRMEKEALAENPEVFGFIVAYEPYQYDRGRRLFAPYCNRKNGVINQIQVENSYDYTDTRTSGLYWYQNPLNRGAGWTEPFFGSASATLMIAYSEPFYGPDRSRGTARPIGVIAIIYSLDGVKRLTQSLGLQGNGYAFILSRQGAYINHPDEEKIKENRTIFEEPIVRDNPRVRLGIQNALAGKSCVIEAGDKATGRDSWLFFEPVRTTGYVMGAVFVKSSVVNHKDFTRRRFILVSLLLVSGIFLLLLLWLCGDELSTRSLWLASVTLVLLVIGEIFFVWFLALKYHYYYRPNTVKVDDVSVLRGFLEDQGEKAKKRHETEPVFIRTGVFLQSLEFENANNVKLTGYIWQKFDGKTPDNIADGFILPEAVSATIERAYSREVNGVRTVGWHFEAVLRQSFEYFKYPLDNKDVWIRIWPRDFDQNVILIPDLSAYTQTDPNTLPGVERDFVIPGWRMTQSFFSFVPNSYNTDFGIDNYTGQENFPELYFSVIITRDFLNPFVANLLPFIVIALVLFGMMLLISYAQEKVLKFESSMVGILAGCAALIFSVIIAHNQLRNSIAADGVLYMEYFYFTLYFAILIVITNAFLVAFESNLALFRYRDNLWFKLALWPVLLTGLLIVTVVTFY
jgi:hypothetical protein